jgi:hypothetical protein
LALPVNERAELVELLLSSLGPVLRKYDIREFSYRDLFQFVFVVKPAEYGNCRNAMVIRNVMPFGLERDLGK